MDAITATDNISLATEARARLVPPPRLPPTALGAESVPPFLPRRVYPRVSPKRVVVWVIRRPSLLRALATSMMLGAIAAITRLGPHPFSLRGVLPILAAGSVFGLVVGVARRLVPHPSQDFSRALVILAGAAGGTVWWMLIQPPSSILVAMGLGALLTQAVVAFELWLRQAAD